MPRTLRNNLDLFCYICGDIPQLNKKQKYYPIYEKRLPRLFRLQNWRPRHVTGRTFSLCLVWKTYNGLVVRTYHSEIRWYGENQQTISTTAASVWVVCLDIALKTRQPWVSQSSPCYATWIAFQQNSCTRRASNFWGIFHWFRRLNPDDNLCGRSGENHLPVFASQADVNVLAEEEALSKESAELIESKLWKKKPTRSRDNSLLVLKLWGAKFV